MAGLFQVLWGDASGMFKKAAVLNGTDDKPLIIPADENTIVENICTRPMAVDWNADGNLDLVVGNFAGSFYVFTGEGKGKFLPEPKQIKTESGPLKIQGAHSDPFPVDWDRDGDLDLLSGSSNGGVQWAENTAGAGIEPSLKAFRDLIKPEGQIVYGKRLDEADLTGPASSTRVWVDDVNSDGKLDILVGDSVRLVSLPAGVSDVESSRKQTQWNKDLAEASKEYQAAAGDKDKAAAARDKMLKIYAQRSEFIIEDSTGFVWLYLQK